MEVTRLIFDLLKGIAWPLFCALVILFCRSEIRNVARFIASLIHERGARLKHGETEFTIDPPGTRSTDPLPSSPQTENPISGEASLSLPALAVHAQGRSEEGSIAFGFQKSDAQGVLITDGIDVPYRPDVKLMGDKPFLLGQKVFFALENGTGKDILLPECYIEYPSSFKHLHTEDARTGLLTTNSDLWGIGGQLTELRDVTLSKSEISSVISRVLRPGDFRRFFIRFNLPQTGGEFSLTMRLRIAGGDMTTKTLRLNVTGNPAGE